MVELVILITGLCGYVPHYDAAGKLTFDVYLVDASHPDSVGEHDKECENHVAGIVVHEDYVDFGGTTHKGGTCLRGSKYWLYPISGEHLSIVPPGSGLEISDDPGEDARCPKSLADTFSYHWVPQMGKVVPKRKLRDLPASIGDTEQRLVRGVLHVAEAKVYAGSLHTDTDGKVTLWKFSNGIFGKHYQAVAETVALYRELEEVDSVKICFDADEAGGCKQRWVKLDAVGTGDGKEIVFWVKNQPAADLIPRPRDGERCDPTGDSDEVYEHFPHLYRFLKGSQKEGEPTLEEPCPALTPGRRLTRAEEKIRELRERFSFVGEGEDAKARMIFTMVNNPQCPGADYDYL